MKLKLGSFMWGLGAALLGMAIGVTFSADSNSRTLFLAGLSVVLLVVGQLLRSSYFRRLKNELRERIEKDVMTEFLKRYGQGGTREP